MQTAAFNVEFYYCRKNVYEASRIAGNKFIARVKVISRSFQLFEVSEIERIGHFESIKITSRYIITSYEIDKVKSSKWRDASNLKSNTFVEAVGKAIDQHYYTSFSN